MHEMVDVFGRDETARRKAAFAQRVQPDVAVANGNPMAAIVFAESWAARLVIFAGGEGFVGLAVAVAGARAAAGIGADAPGTFRHGKLLSLYKL
jgi:hypothetical protein